jgi:rubrerythrin
MDLDVLDFEEVLLELEASRMLRPIAQNFNTRYYRLWDTIEQTPCSKCGGPLFFASSEEEKKCPSCGATI